MGGLTPSAALSSATALVPALAFLSALLFIDSYQLIKPTFVGWVLGAGALVAGVALVINGWLLGVLDLPMATYSRGVAPFVEEALKGLVIVILVRRDRIGFMVDAAILGFAVGSGFAIVENIQFLKLAPHAGFATWLVRGFGTALMHGGATAVVGVVAVAILERRSRLGLAAFLPGYLVAVAMHATYNALSGDPLQATLGALVGVPALLLTVFHFSERSLRAWIGSGFDNDAQMLEMLDTGAFIASPAGIYLESVKHLFHPLMRFDALCYLRLACELSLRAKGLLMLRENGFDVPPLDEATKASLDELRHLERGIGVAGLRILRPLMNASGRDLWQLVLLESTAATAAGPVS